MRTRGRRGGRQNDQVGHGLSQEAQGGPLLRGLPQVVPVVQVVGLQRLPLLAAAGLQRGLRVTCEELQGAEAARPRHQVRQQAGGTHSEPGTPAQPLHVAAVQAALQRKSEGPISPLRYCDAAPMWPHTRAASRPCMLASQRQGRR